MRRVFYCFSGDKRCRVLAMAVGSSLVFFLFLLPVLKLEQVFDVVDGLDMVADFALTYHEDVNFDGLLGFVIAEAQILESLPIAPLEIRSHLDRLLLKFEEIRKLVVPVLPTTPSKMPILRRFLLSPANWIVPVNFTHHQLRNLGLYRTRTMDTILKSRSATFRGVPSDSCLLEILARGCHVGEFCEEMMLAPRTDFGYLLTHRLLYLQVVRLKGCAFHQDTFRELTTNFCSLMLKELRSSQSLNFPNHDIVLEQIVLCGLEGYSEFLSRKLRNRIVSWQTPFGCFRRSGQEEIDLKRSSNVIEFGCTDHSTGLGAAALALNLKYVLSSVGFY